MLYGGHDDDIVIGGSNVAGGLDGDDRIDGGAGHDAIAGDNADICYRPDSLDPRMRALLGTAIYGVQEGVNDGQALVVGLGINGNVYPPFSDPRGNLPGNAAAIHREYHIVLLDHDDAIQQQPDVASVRRWGEDYIAGGAGEDEIFGQLGDDVIQGDGKIGTDARTNLNPVTGQRYEEAGTPTDFGASRTVPTGLEGVGDLQVRPSFETATDGDDYIEGNGGNDVVFGNYGQDDISGGSSDLYGFVLASQRPDGKDLIFGGAGTDITRSDIGEAMTARSSGLPSSAADDLIITHAGGHAHDADVILGDNGRILRLVGVNGVQRALNSDVYANGVQSTGGYLNFNFDFNGTVAEGYGSDGNAATYDRIIVRAVQFLDYHEGGNDFTPSATNDRGLGDELHGESGDDTIYGMTGADVLFGEGQDDDLIGGYGNDWISGGTGADGVIGDDGRFIVSRNATQYGEPLYGVLALLPDDGDTRTFNGNMINEAIATPGSIQQAIVNIGDELKKAVNLTPFSFDADFNGNWDEFTTGVPKKRGATPDNPFPKNADDIIFGGLGSDWLHGGSGDDAILGGEALSLAYTQTYDISGTLTGVTRSDYYRPYNPVDALRYNPEDVDGWHYDRTRRAGEFALYDEYDPLRTITLNADGTANKTDVGGLTWFLNFSTTAGTYVPAGTNPKPVGQTATGYPGAWNDGNDRIFGDTGNDWLVGGTGRDDLYGGFGNDLHNADDDHSTNLNRNDQPDTQPSYEDRAFGGAGRDILIANTGGDRLIDWVGEFNSYLVPFAPFGMATVSRTLQPQLAEFLYTLSASDGADPTRWADTNADPTQRFRNGEPEGELGLIRQKDFAWQDQTGAPTDPQAGNIPGGKRDVLRTASFNDGTMQALAPDSGTWQVSGGALEVAATSNKDDAVAVFQVGDALPSYFEILATVKAIKPTAGWDANSYVIFDYHSPTSFKYAGLNVSTNKIVMGQRTSAGWQNVKQAAFPGGVKNDKWYNLVLSVNGLTATLLVDNSKVLSHTFNATIVDEWSYNLNWGLVGFGSRKSRGALDNISVQLLPAAATVAVMDDFASGTSSLVSTEPDSRVGLWDISNGRLEGRPVAGTDTATQLLRFPGIDHLQTNSLLEMNTTLKTAGRAGFVFDYYSDKDFKWVAIDTISKQVSIGHRTSGGWKLDATVTRSSLAPGVDFNLTVTIKGSTVSVMLDNQAALGYVFNAVATDGRFGLLAQSPGASFDQVTLKSNGAATAQSAKLFAPVGPQSGTQPVFAWTAVAGAVSYELWVNRTDVSQAGVINVSGLTTTTYTSSVPLVSGGQYRAWVRAVSSTGEVGAWSVAIDFTVAVSDVSLPSDASWIDGELLHLLPDQVPPLAARIPSERGSVAVGMEASPADSPDSFSYVLVAAKGLGTIVVSDPATFAGSPMMNADSELEHENMDNDIQWIVNELLAGK